MAPSQRLPARWPSWSPGTWPWSAPTGKTDLPRRTPPQCTPSKTPRQARGPARPTGPAACPGRSGPLPATPPATLAALLIVGVALGINGLFAEFTTSDRDDGIYVLMRSGASAEIKGEGDSSRSLRVTLLTILERPERTNPSLTANPYRKYWAAEVMVENTGAEDISAPAWKLRACGKKYDPVSTRALGEDLADASPSPGRSANRMGRLRNPHLRGARVAARAAIRPSSRPLCLQGALHREEVARDSEW